MCFSRVLEASKVALVVKKKKKKKLSANAGDVRDAGSVPGLGRSPGGGYNNPHQFFLPGEFYGQRRPTGNSP